MTWMSEDERYDMSYLRIIPMPPSIRELAEDYYGNQDECHSYTGDREFEEFEEMIFWKFYKENVVFATHNYGQDFRTRRYTRDELGYGYDHFPKPIIWKSVDRDERKYKQMWKDETNRTKINTIKISWDGALI